MSYKLSTKVFISLTLHSDLDRLANTIGFFKLYYTERKLKYITNIALFASITKLEKFTYQTKATIKLNAVMLTFSK